MDFSIKFIKELILEAVVIAREEGYQQCEQDVLKLLGKLEVEWSKKGDNSSHYTAWTIMKRIEDEVKKLQGLRSVAADGVEQLPGGGPAKDAEGGKRLCSDAEPVG